MGTLVLDSSVVIAFSKPEDVLHTSAVATLGAARRSGEEFVLPASVLAEALVHPYRLGQDVGRSSERDLTALFGPVRAIDQEVASLTARLRAGDRSLRLPDALVIATGIVEQAVTLTYDPRLAGVDVSVRVLAP